MKPTIEAFSIRPKRGEAFEAFEAFRSSSDCVDLICSLCEFRSRVGSMHWPEKKADSSRHRVNVPRCAAEKAPRCRVTYNRTENYRTVPLHLYAATTVTYYHVTCNS